MHNPLVVGDEEVQACVARPGAERFDKLLRDWRHCGVADGDHIVGPEIMDYSERCAVVFDYAKPSGSVGRIRWFVDPGGDFVADDFDYLVVDTGRDRDVPVNPGRVRYGRDANRGKEIGIPVAAFGFYP